MRVKHFRFFFPFYNTHAMTTSIEKKQKTHTYKSILVDEDTPIHSPSSRTLLLLPRNYSSQRRQPTIPSQPLLRPFFFFVCDDVVHRRGYVCRYICLLSMLTSTMTMMMLCRLAIYSDPKKAPLPTPKSFNRCTTSLCLATTHLHKSLTLNMDTILSLLSRTNK